MALILVGTMPNSTGIMPDGIVPLHSFELCLWNFAPRGFGAFYDNLERQIYEKIDGNDGTMPSPKKKKNVT